ncbi:MAG: metalloprotease [Geodermatophilaceae bacterium]|nr:metalloprotease [Geodermatophilaceae bacterium]
MRMLVTPKWLFGHVVVALLFLACLWLGRWQLDRFQSVGGGPQNLAYALQWPVFAAFGLWFWYRILRDALSQRERPTRRRVHERDAADDVHAVIVADEAADPSLAAYNRYLASLHEGLPRA